VFFKNFLAKYPEFKARDLIFTGASYGGHWAPYFAYGLDKLGDENIRITGLVLASSYLQGAKLYESYPRFSVDSKQYTQITDDILKTSQKLTDLCSQLISVKDNPMYASYLIDVCDKAQATTYSANPNFNYYFMPNDEQDNFHFVDFVSYPEVQNYLGVKKTEFLACNTTFTEFFRPGDLFEDSSPMVAHFLDKNVKVLMFSGD